MDLRDLRYRQVPEDQRDRFHRQVPEDQRVRQRRLDLADRQARLHRQDPGDLWDRQHPQVPGDQQDPQLLLGLADPQDLWLPEYLEALPDPSDLPDPGGQQGPAGNLYNRNCTPRPCSHTLWGGGVCTNCHQIVDHTSDHRSHCICSTKIPPHIKIRTSSYVFSTDSDTIASRWIAQIALLSLEIHMNIVRIYCIGVTHFRLLLDPGKCLPCSFPFNAQINCFSA